MIRSAVFLQLAFLTASSFSAAQQLSRNEVAIGVGGVSDTPDGGTPAAAASAARGYLDSPVFRYTFNVNRALAVESSLSDSFSLDPGSIRQGGHQLLALGGIKAGLRGRRFGVFGTSAAGVASFSRGAGVYTATGIDYQRVTHFALQQGVALEYYPGPRTILRFDADELLDAQFRRVYIQTPEYSVTSFGAVPYHASFSFTVAHRFGTLSDLPAQAPAPRAPRYSVGGLFVMEIREHLLETEVRAEGGGGAWVGFPLWRFLSGDVIAYDHPHDDHTANIQDGGTTFAAFAGPKIGFRHGPFGFYAKARPGIMRFSRTNVYQGFTKNDFIIYDRPKIDFALDTGGVFEYAPQVRGLHHALLRFEGGSTYIHYHGADLTVGDGGTGLQPYPGYTTYYDPPQRHSSLLFLTGVGFSF